MSEVKSPTNEGPETPEIKPLQEFILVIKALLPTICILSGKAFDYKEDVLFETFQSVEGVMTCEFDNVQATEKFTIRFNTKDKKWSVTSKAIIANDENEEPSTGSVNENDHESSYKNTLIRALQSFNDLRRQLISHFEIEKSEIIIVLGKNYAGESKNASKPGWNAKLSIGSELNSQALACEIVKRVSTGNPLPGIITFSTGPTAGERNRGIIPTECEAMYEHFLNILKNSLSEEDYGKVLNSGMLILLENHSTTTKSNAVQTKSLFEVLGLYEKQALENLENIALPEIVALNAELANLARAISTTTDNVQRLYFEKQIYLVELKLKQILKPPLKGVQIWTLYFHLPRSEMMFQRYGNMETEGVSTDGRVIQFLISEKNKLQEKSKEFGTLRENPELIALFEKCGYSQADFTINLNQLIEELSKEFGTLRENPELIALFEKCGYSQADYTINLNQLIEELEQRIDKITTGIEGVLSYQKSRVYRLQEPFLEFLGRLAEYTGALNAVEKLVQYFLRNKKK